MKVLKVAAIVVGVVALAATAVATFGASLGIAASIVAAAGTVASVASIASVAIGVGAQLATPKAGFSNEGNPLDFQTNPNSGLPYVIGRTRQSGVKIAGRTAASPSWTKHDLVFFGALLSCAPILSVESFAADNIAISFDGSGNAVTSGYVGWMAQKVSLGPTPQTTALSLSLNGTAFPGWTSAHKLSGMAHALIGYRYDSEGNHYQGGVPEPSWIILGRKCYDPRKDSTYPGGSGAHRWNDESTWEWSRNPGLNALAWTIGRYANGKLVCGIGAPIETIRIWEFVECANVNDANGWGLGGVEYTSDSKWDVFSRMLRAGGAVPTKSGAMIGCRVNTPRVSIGTVESADFLDELIFPLTKPRRNRFNTVLPRYASEAHGWQVITGSEMTVPAYVTADGGKKRTKGIDFPLVQAEIGQSGFDGNKQVGELAMYEIVNSREAGPIQFTTGPKWSGVHSGDCVVLNKPEDDIANVKVLITGVTADPATGKFHFTAETETDSKHAFALGKTTTPPPAPTLTVPPGAVSVPSPSDWTVTPITMADGQPGLRLSGTITDPVADSLLVGLSVAGAGQWVAQPTLSGAGVVRYDIGPLDSSVSWDVRIAYSAAGRAGDWLEISGIATGLSDIARRLGLTASYGTAFPSAADSATNQLLIRTDLANRLFVRVPGDGLISIGGSDITIGGSAIYLPPWMEITDGRTVEALAAAQAAYVLANDAIDALADLADDGIISASEKTEILVPKSVVLADRYTNLIALATSLSVSHSAADTAYSNWTSFLGTLSPAWNDKTQDSPVVRSDYDGYRDSLDAALETLDKAIKTAAAAQAEWASVSSRPAELTDGRIPAGLDSSGNVQNDKVGIPALKIGTTGTYQNMTTNYGGAKSVAASVITTFGPYNVATSNADAAQILRYKLSVNVGSPGGAITNAAIATLYLKYFDGSTWHVIGSVAGPAFNASLVTYTLDRTAYGQETAVTWSGPVTYGLFLELTGGDGGAESTLGSCLLDVITRK